MNKRLLFIFYITTPVLLFPNSGTAIIPQEYSLFWIANLFIILIEIFVAFRFKPSITIKKGALLIALGNVVSTILGILFFLIYLKVWEFFQYIESSIKEIILAIVLLYLPTISIEFLFYKKIFEKDSLKQKIIKTNLINIISYIPLTIIIILLILE